MVSTHTTQVIRHPEQAHTLLDPMRLRLLRNLEFPISAAGLARRLHLPRQKVNYHLRELERAGLARLVRERRVGNCTERLVQAAATRFVLSPEILGPLAPEPRTLPEHTLRERVVFEGAESPGAFTRDLAAAVHRLSEEHGHAPEPGETAHWVVVGLHAANDRRRLPDPRLRG